MSRARFLAGLLAALICSCADGSTSPGPLSGTYTLISENGEELPSEPGGPSGCCLTLTGSLSLTPSTYELHTSHRNKNTGLLFENSEHGTYSREGNTLTFTRVGGGGEGFPYLLAPGTVSTDGDTITLEYGDEGPGSNQIRGVFRR